MIQWKYEVVAWEQVIWYGPNDTKCPIRAYLRKMGLEGWELVQMTIGTGFVFKQQIPEPVEHPLDMEINPQAN